MAELAFLLPYIVGGAASAVVGSLLKEDAPSQQVQQTAPPLAAPAVEPVPKMPTINDASRRAATRRSIAEQRARMGRASTVLTDDIGDTKIGG